MLTYCSGEGGNALKNSFETLKGHVIMKNVASLKYSYEFCYVTRIAMQLEGCFNFQFKSPQFSGHVLSFKIDTIFLFIFNANKDRLKHNSNHKIASNSLERFEIDGKNCMTFV